MAQALEPESASALPEPPPPPTSRLRPLKRGLRRQLGRFVDLGPDSGFDGLRWRLARARHRGNLREAGPDGTIPVGFFDDLYASRADPWSYGQSFQDERRHTLMLGSLPRPRFRSAYEPACAVGHLSARLAERCDRLLCSDVAAEAVAHARQNLARFEHVTVEQHYLPADVPDGSFDLVVLSDLCVYLSPDKLEELLDRVLPVLEPGGTLLVNDGRWVAGPIIQGGDEVYHRIRRRPELHKQAGYRDFGIRISVFERQAG